jgi:hypothetical protein
MIQSLLQEHLNSLSMKNHKERADKLLIKTVNIIKNNKPIITVSRKLDNLNTHIIDIRSVFSKEYIIIDIKELSNNIKHFEGIVHVDDITHYQLYITNDTYNYIIQTIEDIREEPIENISIDLLKYVD